MMSIDCTDCFTKVEFTQNTIQTSFEDIEKVLVDQKDQIRMFMVDDYMFEFVEYLQEGDKSDGDFAHYIVGRYITPITHLTYMSEEETWFKIDEKSIDKFTFFFENEIIISMHGIMFFAGQVIENLTLRFSVDEIRDLNNELCAYIKKHYDFDQSPLMVWNFFKCIELY